MFTQCWLSPADAAWVSGTVIAATAAEGGFPPPRPPPRPPGYRACQRNHATTTNSTIAPPSRHNHAKTTPQPRHNHATFTHSTVTPSLITPPLSQHHR